MANVTINGKEYDYEALSATAKQQFQNMLVCDRKLQQLNNEILMIRTARASFASALQAALNEK